VGTLALDCPPCALLLSLFKLKHTHTKIPKSQASKTNKKTKP
jgi:hypothetical protein